MTACNCGKVRYLTRRHAKRAGTLMTGRKGKLRAYQCPGGFWHLTSQAGARRAAWGAYSGRRADGL